MSAFYEIHDSMLERLEWHGTMLEVIFRAVCIVSDDDSPLALGRQRIVLRIEGASVSGDKVEPTIWLLDGDFACESQVPFEYDPDNGCISAYLQEANRIHLHLFGENEETHDFPTFDIRGESMTLQKLGPVEWSKKTIPAVASAKARTLEIRAFDFDLPGSAK